MLDEAGTEYDAMELGSMTVGLLMWLLGLMLCFWIAGRHSPL